MRTAGFLAALAAVFGVAIAVSAAVGPEPSDEAPASRHAGDAAADPVRGLAAEEDGLRLVVATPEIERGAARGRCGSASWTATASRSAASTSSTSAGCTPSSCGAI